MKTFICFLYVPYEQRYATQSLNLEYYFKEHCHYCYCLQEWRFFLVRLQLSTQEALAIKSGRTHVCIEIESERAKERA